MNILKRENWPFFLITHMMGLGLFIIASYMDIYEEKAWYTNWKYWLLAAIFVFPLSILTVAFYIEILIKVASKFNINGSEYYSSPYVWIMLALIPFIGWLALLIMSLYLNIMIIVKISEGALETYRK